MIRITVTLSIMALLTACGDGRGSQYSSARASLPAPTYIPVTPGATPVDTVPAGAVPVSVVPAGTPVTSLPAPVAETTVLTPAPSADNTQLTQAVVVTPAPEPVVAAPVVTQAAASLPRTPAAPEPVTRFATGPIYSACQKAGRKAASRARCGCVQWVADQELSQSDQRRGASYFNNQHELQEVRQSQDRIASNERFWKVWKSYGQSAAAQCKGT